MELIFSVTAAMMENSVEGLDEIFDYGVLKLIFWSIFDILFC